MKLPQHPALPLISLVLLGYLCGDVTCAVLEREFSGRPQRQVGGGQSGIVPLNLLKSRGELTFMLTAHTARPGDVSGPTITGPTTTQGPNPRPGAPNATILPELTGTLAGQGQSLAVLQVGQETQVVGVGEEWMGFKVLEVGAFQARLRDARNQEYTVSMPLAKGDDTPAPPIPLTPFNNNNGNGNGNNSPPSAPAPGQPYTTSRELRDDLDNKGQWIRNILVQPVVREGESVGVQINYSNTNNPFNRLGIQTGDVVLSLNNKPARGVEDVTNLLMELRNSTTLNFQIERGGQQVPITVTLEP